MKSAFIDWEISLRRELMDRSAMATVLCIQEQGGGANMNTLNGLWSQEIDPFGGDIALAPKVRKPYTITKQRERWTGEEHKKFLEALQLYGRAWRRIEEHIGTKTAVQIRSHAQKFFSKVMREANGGGPGNLKQIKIPPPRPKRKPTHPYPRKEVHPSGKEILLVGQLERSSSEMLSVSEQDNRSPKSVLSALGSETTDAFFSNKPSRSTSLVASGAGSNKHEHENGIQSAISVDGDSNLSLDLTSDGQTTEDRFTMEIDSSSEEHICPKKSSSQEAAVPALKLFGRTVLFTDCGKPTSTIAIGNAVDISLPSVSSKAHHKDIDSDVQAIQDGSIGGYPMGAFPHRLLPMFYCLPSPYGDAANTVAVPWWALHGNMPFPFSHSQQHFGSMEDLPGCNVQNECSGTSSNTTSGGGYVCDSQQVDQCREKEAENMLVPKLRKNSALSNQKAVSDSKNTRGFVPYKRCLVEEEVERPQMAVVEVGECQTEAVLIEC